MLKYLKALERGNGMKRPKVSSGFSLTEILITLVFIGVASAIIIPKIMKSIGTKLQDTKTKESVSVFKQILSNGPNDSTGLGLNWATYIKTQMVNQFSSGTSFTPIDGNGCSGDTAAGYTSESVILKDGAIFRVLSNGIIGTRGGEIDFCIDPIGDTYTTTPPATLGKDDSPGYVGVVDLTADTIRLNLRPTVLAGLGDPKPAVSSGVAAARNNIGGAPLNLFN